MRKFSLLVLAATLVFFTQQVFADDSVMTNSSEGKACGVIADTCLSAGYTRDENTNKKFWQGCMKPLLYGQKVVGLNIDSATLNACRHAKVNELQQELKDLQAAIQK